MLSKPWLIVSGGSSVVASMSSASRSRIALAYSARFRRCRTGRPGLGRAAAVRSSEAASQPTMPSSDDWSGRGAPAGGMAPAPTFRMTFSQVAGSAAGRVRSAPCRLRPAAFWRSLWHPAQYCVTSFWYSPEGDDDAGLAGGRARC